MKSSLKEKTAVCFVLIFFALNFASPTVAQQVSAPRERIVPTQTPTPKPSQTPVPGSTPTPLPTVTPAPQQLPTPQPQTQSLAELQSGIRSILLRPELARSHIGIKIVSLATGVTVSEQNAEKYFMPASNMKNFTVAAALDRLSPNHRFTTSVYAPAPPDASGTIRGDVIVYGRGDPLISTAPQNGASQSTLDDLAAKIAASGVKRIEGSLVGDESYFSGDPVQVTWEWDDLQWESGAEVSALSINDNLIRLQIAPGAAVGAPLSVSLAPANQLFTIINFSQTGAAGTKQELEVYKRLGTNVLEIRGTMPVGGKNWSNLIAVAKPAELFVALLKNALAQKGVVVSGQTRAVDAKARKPAPLDLTKWTEIARYDSQPFSVIAAKTMKPSQNTYTEIILRTLGETFGDKTEPNKTSAERGIGVIKKFLTEAGISADSVVQWDGSGLSRHNLITPNAAAQLYVFMNKHRSAAAWRESLTIAGVDGTLQNRFKNTIAAGNVRGKTGTIDQVSALSGYLTTAAGEPLAFSIIINTLPAGSALQRRTIDEIVLLLANFNGKTN